MAIIRRYLVLFLLVFGSLAWAQKTTETYQVKPEGWPIPNVKESIRQGRRFEDRTPLIPGDETKAVGYVGRGIPLFVTWSIDGNIFEIIVDEDGRAPFEYSLWDMNGDGKFEMKAGAYLDISAPRWVVERYFARRGIASPWEKKPQSEKK